MWCYYAVKLIKTVEVASIKSSNRMCRTHVKIVERERRRRNGSSEEPGPGHTINNRMTVIPIRDGELSNCMLIRADRIYYVQLLFIFEADGKKYF